MGNCCRKLVTEHVIICQLIDVLDQVITKRVSDVTTYSFIRDVEVTQLECMLGVVRSHSVHTLWELMVHNT